MKTKKLSDMVSDTLNGPEIPKALRKVKPKAPYIPSSDDPIVELRRLVRQHVALTKSAVAVEHMSSDRKNHETGEIIACRLPLDAQAEGHVLAKAYKKKADALGSAMLRELKKIPIYQLWLGRVFGARGAIVSAYLVSEIDIQRAVKPSNLRRFCGLAVVDGALERRTGGSKVQGGTGTYHAGLRTRLWQMFDSMWKNQRHAPDNKYLQIWRQYVHRIEHSERVSDRGVDAQGKWIGKYALHVPRRRKDGKPLTHVSARGFAHSYGWHKAADVFLEDLYTVWRAIEGLPVWPSYYAAKLGYEHGGKICVNAPKMLTVDEAIELVGPNVFAGAGDEGAPEEPLEAAAE